MNYIGVVVFKDITYAKSLFDYDIEVPTNFIQNDLKIYFQLEHGYRNIPWYWGDTEEPKENYIIAELMTEEDFQHLYYDQYSREDIWYHLYKGYDIPNC